MTKHEQDMARCAAKIKALQDYVDWLEEALSADIAAGYTYHWPDEFVEKGREVRRQAIASTNKANEPDTPAS